MSNWITNFLELPKNDFQLQAEKSDRLHKQFAQRQAAYVRDVLYQGKTEQEILSRVGLVSVPEAADEVMMAERDTAREDLRTLLQEYER